MIVTPIAGGRPVLGSSSQPDLGASETGPIASHPRPLIRLRGGIIRGLDPGNLRPHRGRVPGRDGPFVTG